MLNNLTEHKGINLYFIMTDKRRVFLHNFYVIFVQFNAVKILSDNL